MPADPHGKHQHVVEVLDTVDAGSSLLINAQPRTDYTAETTLRAVAETLEEHGLPDEVMFDRDTRFVGRVGRRDVPSPFVRFWLCLGVHATVLPPRRPDLNCYVERYHRAYDEECLAVFQPRDLPQVCAVTARYKQHYNLERPHQGDACGNRPPQVALAERAAQIPARPRLPAVIDPDRWLDVLDGQRFVRKVASDTSVTVDRYRYYVSRTVVGSEVSLRVDATRREFVVEQQGQELKRLPIKGLGNSPLPFGSIWSEYVRKRALISSATVRSAASCPYLSAPESVPATLPATATMMVPSYGFDDGNPYTDLADPIELATVRPIRWLRARHTTPRVASAGSLDRQLPCTPEAGKGKAAGCCHRRDRSSLDHRRDRNSHASVAASRTGCAGRCGRAWALPPRNRCVLATCNPSCLARRWFDRKGALPYYC